MGNHSSTWQLRVLALRFKRSQTGRLCTKFKVHASPSQPPDVQHAGRCSVFLQELILVLTHSNAISSAWSPGREHLALPLLPGAHSSLFCGILLYSGADLSRAVVLHWCASGSIFVRMWFKLSGSLEALVGIRVFSFKHFEMSAAPTLVLSEQIYSARSGEMNWFCYLWN